MSDVQSIMKFESLPNEIIIECFEYLNMIDIFYSFDMLNSRFHHLIRNIPLHLHVEDMDEATLTQFCFKMQSNSEMKNQILSLTIPDIYISRNVDTLFSYVSLNEFAQLRSLILNKLDSNLTSKISSVLPLLTNLRYFGTCELFYELRNILSSLPRFTIRTISIPEIHDNFICTHPFKSLVNLIVSRCNIKDLYDLFEELPTIQYLNIQTFPYLNQSAYHPVVFMNKNVVDLKRLIIDNFLDNFKSCEMLLKRTPNLKVFKLSSDHGTDLVDATRWQQLITTSLPHLDVFKFKFSYQINDDDDNIVEKFQNNFWYQQHHWYIEGISNKYKACIFTVPYISNKYEITPFTKRTYNKLSNNINTFTNVTNLKMCPEAMKKNNEYYFPNVKSLGLEKGSVNKNNIYPFFEINHILCLKTIINLYSVTQLDVPWYCHFESPSVLLLLLKEAPCLSSLGIDKEILLTLLDDRELCECFSKMIKKLNIAGFQTNILNFEQTKKICKVFINMEEFRCNIGQPDNLQMTINQLSKLVYLRKFSYITPYSKTGSQWLNDHVLELNSYSFRIKCENVSYDDQEEVYSDDEIQYDIFSSNGISD